MNFLFNAKTEYLYVLAVKYQFTGTDYYMYTYNTIIIDAYLQTIHNLLKHVEGMFYYSHKRPFSCSSPSVKAYSGQVKL